ncbi:hypothetical protein NPIL_106491, partial [Nephila pilipes]
MVRLINPDSNEIRSAKEYDAVTTIQLST